jgi:hypothetical protein
MPACTITLALPVSSNTRALAVRAYLHDYLLHADLCTAVLAFFHILQESW